MKQGHREDTNELNLQQNRQTELTSRYPVWLLRRSEVDGLLEQLKKEKIC